MAKDVIHNAVKQALANDGWTMIVVNLQREEIVKWIS
jgi:hypothetical protein